MASAPRLFELRTYHAAPGRMDALLARFRDKTIGLFERHGFTVVGFWRATDGDGRPTDVLVYVLAFSDRAAADATWAGFRVDPEWIEAKKDSERDGPLTVLIESVFMTATDFSPLT